MNKIRRIYRFIIVTLICLVVRDRNKNNWILSSSFNNKFNYNSKYFFEFLLTKTNINAFYVIDDRNERERLNTIYNCNRFIGSNSIKEIIFIVKSNVWLISAGLVLEGIGLHRNRVIVNLWHGIPLKRIVLLENRKSYFYKVIFRMLYSRNYTHITTTSNAFIPIMAKSFGVTEKTIKVWGQPRTDQLLKNEIDDNKLVKEITVARTKKRIILYAPTYRNNPTKFFPFSDFSVDNLNSFLEENKLFLYIKPHQSEENHAIRYESSNIHIINDNEIDDIIDVLKTIDLLITDYSSIYIDYLLTLRPMLFLPYDYESYHSERGFNIDYFKHTPGPKPKNFDEFKSEIITLLTENNYYFSERVKMNEYFNSFKGNSSETIYSSILSELKGKGNL